MEFERILQMSQKELKRALAKKLRGMGYEITNANGYLYAAGEEPVLLVAHLDTVHQRSPSVICYSEDRRYMMSPYGIGGDDRAGVYMILQIINMVRCHVLFCEDEEAGGRGAREFALRGIRPDVNFIVELDRRGSNDAVFYSCGNDEFTNFVCDFGFTEAIGSFSDISIIAPALGTAAVNISAGYFNEHRLNEYIDMQAVENNIQRVAQMVQVKTKFFPYVKRRQFTFGSVFGQTSLYNLFGKNDEESGGYKLLMPLPDTVRLLLNDYEIFPASNYLMDRNGDIYIYLEELGAAVESEALYPYDENGELPAFSARDAQHLPVISFEAAMEKLYA